MIGDNPDHIHMSRDSSKGEAVSDKVTVQILKSIGKNENLSNNLNVIFEIINSLTGT